MQTNDGRAALAELLAFIRDDLKSRVGDYLQEMERALTDAWPDIRDPEKQAESRYTARWLKANRTAVESALYQHFLRGLAASATTPVAGDLSGLDLLDETALSLSVIRAKLTDNVMQGAKPEVTRLLAQLDALRQSGAPLNPKGIMPDAFMCCFIEVLGELKAPPDVQALLVQRLADQGAAILIELYTGINRLLSAHGESAPDAESR